MKKTPFAKAEFRDVVIPTYPVSEPEKLPIFFEKRPYQGASGKLYPLPYTGGLSDEKKDVTYRAAVLENDYLCVEILPQLGGKIHFAREKTNGTDFIYHNKVIKPAMVGLAGPWVSGGIEFNWPQHHRPTTFMPVECILTEEDGEATAWVGETDPLYRMRSAAGISVEPGRSYFKVKVRLFNPTPLPQPVMWWANTAVKISDGYRVIFPPDVIAVNDHDRRAVLSWPIARGVYYTARPFDFGEGTDLQDLQNIRVPSSYLLSKGQSDGDYLAGYDDRNGCGCVMVADHHAVPGKKFWHWGEHPFGAKWCANLTDDGSRYVELMTGAYTDNQPDFTWLAPYETRCFEQYWYPIREIGGVKNATKDAAINLEIRDGVIRAGVCATGVFRDAGIVVRAGDKVLLDARADVAPDKAFLTEFPADGADPALLSLTVLSREGKTLAAFTPAKLKERKPPEPRKPSPDPKTVETCEELYLNGRHLEQVRHFARDPEAYYREALSRDPGDARCNTAMAERALRRGQYEEAVAYADRALKRLCLRNFNPEDTGAHYLRGLALRYLGREEEAADAFHEAAWSARYAGPAYLALAELEARSGRIPEALEHLEKALALGGENVAALQLKADLTGDEETRAKLKALDPLSDVPTDKPQYFVDRAVALARAGLKKEALAVLEKAPVCGEVLYYRAYFSGDRRPVSQAEDLPWGPLFPSRPEDEAVLSWAKAPVAQYHLGCLLYDRGRYAEAAAAWEKAVKARSDLAPAWRGLALAYYDHLGRKEDALKALKKAFRKDPDSDRILYELQQLLKNTGAAPEERLALYQANRKLADRRDDCTLDRAVLLTQTGRLDEARDALLSHRFHSYEGGEGNLTRHHAWLHVLRGFAALDGGRPREALAEWEAGFTFPACYGEEKGWFAQESHLYYGAAMAARALGDTEKAARYLQKAQEDHAAPTEISFFRALALRRAGKADRAEALLRELLETGREWIRTRDELPYFGVGSPVPAPFEYDLSAVKETKGRLYAAFAYLGLGEKERAEAEADRAREIDPWNFHLYLFSVFKKRIEEKGEWL